MKRPASSDRRLPGFFAALAGESVAARSVAQILGYPFAPGDVVIDRVTGELGKVISVTRRAVRRPSPGPATR